MSYHLVIILFYSGYVVVHRHLSAIFIAFVAWKCSHCILLGLSSYFMSIESPSNVSLEFAEKCSLFIFIVFQERSGRRIASAPKGFLDLCISLLYGHFKWLKRKVSVSLLVHHIVSISCKENATISL